MAATNSRAVSCGRWRVSGVRPQTAELIMGQRERHYPIGYPLGSHLQVHISIKFVANLPETGNKTDTLQEWQVLTSWKSVIAIYEPNQWEGNRGLSTENIPELNPLEPHRPSTSLGSRMRDTLERSQALCFTGEGNLPERQLDRETTTKVWLMGSDTFQPRCWNVVQSCSSPSVREAVLCFRRVSQR